MTKKEKEKLRQDLDLLKKEELIQILLDKEEKEKNHNCYSSIVTHIGGKRVSK